MKISAIVHTQNSEATLEKTLKSLRWADEVVVLDMASVDGTTRIATRYAHHIVPLPKAPRVDGTRNVAIEHATHEWVFVLDSDEYLAEDAGEVLREYIRTYGKRYDAFALPRFNYLAGQIMRGSAWYPDHQIRLFKKGTVRWSDTIHVMPVVTTGRRRLLELKPPSCPHIHHRNYENLRHFIRKQIEYALSDNYDSNPESFDYSAYVAGAYEIMALRSDPEHDGDLSHALSLLMAWDSLIRGLIHWDSLQPRPPLGYLKALPIASCQVAWSRLALKRWLARRYPIWCLARRFKNRFWDFGWSSVKDKVKSFF